MPTSNIDDVLMGGKSAQHPQTPEFTDEVKSNQAVGDIEGDAPEDYSDNEDFAVQDEESEHVESNAEEEAEKPARITDDYGNEEEPVSDVIRERLARQAKKFEAEINDLRSQLASQGASREVQQAARDFEYDPESSGDWQQQLAAFVKQTVRNMGREEQEARTRQQEMQLQTEFETKLRTGMSKFDDFVEVVSGLPFEISNPMTLATRAMSDPAAFLYAAAKRQPQELERISKIRDPYAQMTEMGKLEERMRRNKPTTNAPRPLGRTTEYSSTPETKKKSEPTIEDLIARADAKKIARRKGAPVRGRR